MTWFIRFSPFLPSHSKAASDSSGSTRLCLTILLLGISLVGSAQGLVTGHIIDAATGKPLPYVNIGIKAKNTGTVSFANGAFSLPLPTEAAGDTLTFSLVGYSEVNLPIQKKADGAALTISMTPKVVHLQEVNVAGRRPVEKTFGIRNRNLLVHFTDGMFLKQDSFEIGQLIKLGEDQSAQITSVNLYISAPRKDSASFRINFYRLEEDRPAGRIVEKSILQRHPIQEGWLTFDLTAHNIFLKGRFVVAIEFIPEQEPASSTPILYEVKLGGSSRSFYRKSSLGQWNSPPHHYCLNVTALVDRLVPETEEDTETPPLFSYRSSQVQDTFAIFVRLPAGYHRKATQRFPVLYHLDGNAYFDQISMMIDQLANRKKLRVEPIVVGIGYKNSYLMDSLRVRDYTYPAAPLLDSLPLSGGGERFYQFITDELIPEIQKRFRVDTTNRVLMGHSFGGYFTLFALEKSLSARPVFNQFVAASPSLAYGDHYLFRQFVSPQNRKQTGKDYTLFLSMGELELAEDPSARKAFTDFVEQLGRSGELKIQSKVYRQLEHMGTAIPSFEDGIRFIWGR